MELVHISANLRGPLAEAFRARRELLGATAAGVVREALAQYLELKAKN